MGLTEPQVEAVLSESLHRGFFELDVDGNLPRDLADRTKAAEELLRQCRLSYRAGNRTEGVVGLLFIAEDELVSAQPNSDTGGQQMAATAEVDLSAHSLDALKKFEKTLMEYPDQTREDVQENLALVRSEIAKKGGAAEVQDAPAPVAEPTPDPTPTSEVVAPAVDRNVLVDRLTFSMMRSHGIDPSQVDGLSVDDLQWIIDHPGGGAQTPAEPTPTPAPALEAPVDLEGQTTVMVVNREPEPAPTTPVASEENAPKNDIDPEREELESQITGPILKAYGRGRVDVPGIGINELRFMIQNPEGRVSPEQLAAAKALDDGDTESAAQATPPEPAIAETEPAQESVPSPEMVVTEEVLGPEQTDHFLPPVEPDVSAEDQSEKVAAPVTIDVPREDVAAQIIERERFPIPEDIEQPPRMPADMSKVMQDELYSLHARFHAVESRANWVISQEEDRVADLEKLLRGREVEVLNDLPIKDPEDGRKRLTESQRDALVAADPAVQSIKVSLHQATKIVRKLKVLRDNYHRDVERCSRQMTRFTQEREGAR